MEKVTNTNQLTRGQKVVLIDETNGFSAKTYRYIGETVSSSCQKTKEHFGYFVDLADCPIRLFLHEAGDPIYKDYTRKDILMLANEHLKEELAKNEAELNREKNDSL